MRAAFALTVASLAVSGAHGVELPAESLLKIANAIAIVEESYFQPVAYEQLLRKCREAYSQPAQQNASPEQKEQLCLQAMMASLDKYSDYIGPEKIVALQAPLPLDRAFKSERLSDGTLLVRPGQFTEAVLIQLASALTLVSAQPPVERIILDLRHCEGGILTSTIGVAAAFLPPSTLIFSARGRLQVANMVAYSRPEYYSRGTNPFARLPAKVKELPMLVLVDAETAAGAEIVAGALQDYGRAIVVGRQTMGRGTVQTIKLLGPQQALKVTTAVISRPKGGALDSVGITPDIATSLEGPELVSFAVRQMSLARP